MGLICRDLDGEEEDVDGEFVFRASISNRGGRYVLKGSLRVGSEELEIGFFPL